MSNRINSERLHTLGLPLSNGRKPDYDKRDKYEPKDRYGRTDYDRRNESNDKVR